MKNLFRQQEKRGLYNPDFEKDACGVGLLFDIHGKKSHKIVWGFLLWKKYLKLYL